MSSTKEVIDNKITALQLLQHSQRLAEHMRTQMDMMLVIVRESTELYKEHIAFVQSVVKGAEHEAVAENDSSTPTIQLDKPAS